MTGSAPTLQAMTLEEAIRRVNENGWSLTFDYLTGICITNDNGDSLTANYYRTWPEAVSDALGVPVVERDDTAELVEALEAALPHLRLAKYEEQQFNQREGSYRSVAHEALSRAEAALAKRKERQP